MMVYPGCPFDAEFVKKLGILYSGQAEESFEKISVHSRM